MCWRRKFWRFNHVISSWWRVSASNEIVDVTAMHWGHEEDDDDETLIVRKPLRRDAESAKSNDKGGKTSALTTPLGVWGVVRVSTFYSSIYTTPLTVETLFVNGELQRIIYWERRERRKSGETKRKECVMTHESDGGRWGRDVWMMMWWKSRSFLWHEGGIKGD